MNPIEKLFVGSLIVTAEHPQSLAPFAKSGISTDDLTDRGLRIVFDAIHFCIRDGNEPTVETILATIVRNEMIDLSTGRNDTIVRTRDFIKDVASQAVNEVVAFNQVEEVLLKGKQEKHIRSLPDEIRKIVEGNDPYSIKMEKVQSLIQEMNRQWAPVSRIYSHDDLILAGQTFIEQQRDMIESKARLMTLAPEFGLLRSYVPYLRKGLLYVVRGPTGGNKSSLVRQQAEWLAECGFNVVLFMWEDDIYRYRCQQAARLVPGTTFDMVWRGDPTNAMEAANDTLSKWKENGGTIIPIYAAGQTPAWAVARLDEIMSTQSVDVVIMDYLQKMDVSSIQIGDRQDTGLAAAGELLKQRAEMIGSEVVMVLVSQETKEGDGRAHVKGATAIEDKAQVIFAIKRFEATEPEVFDGVTLAAKSEQSIFATIAVVKNNDGAKGEEKMVVIGPRFMFKAQRLIGRNYDRTIPTLRMPSVEEVSRQRAILAAYERTNSAFPI